MKQGSKKMAIRALMVGGVVALGLVTATRRCDQPKPDESVQESAPALSAPTKRPVPAPPRPPAPSGKDGP